jgi:hypothetical protein
MKCKTTRDLGVVSTWQSPLIVERDGRRLVPAGTIIDQAEHPETNCVALVRNGEAVPMDEECREAARMTAAQVAAAVAARARLEDGDLEADDEESN